MELRVLTVDTDTVEVLIPIMPEVAEIGHFLQDFRLGCEDRPTFYRMEYFGGMEAARRYIPVAEDRATVYFDPEGMCPVVDDFQVMFFCDQVYCRHVAGNSIDMSGEDGGSLGSDGCFDFRRIDVAGPWIYIDKDRFASFPDDAAGSGDIGKRCGDNLTGKFQRFDGDLNGDGSVAGIEQVFDAEIFLQAKFQFVDQRSVVGKPVALPYPIEVSLIFGLGRKEGFGYWNHGCWRLSVVGCRLSGIGCRVSVVGYL